MNQTSKHSTVGDDVTQHARDVIFLSHAMPEDTQFAAWLAIQLANAGYRVWSEATQLVGGEYFWTDIEEAFDTVVGKTIVVVSAVTRKKDGVLNEIERAVATAERLGIEPSSFLIPVTVADLRRGDLPIQLGRQNAIQFHPSWAEGLARLLKLLTNEDFPQSASRKAVGAWVTNWYEGKHRILDQESELMTNALGISSLPERVRFYNVDVTADRLKDIPRRLSIPSVISGALLITFASLNEIAEQLGEDISVSLRADVHINDFLDGIVAKGDPVVLKRDASSHVVNMLRQAWDSYCEKRGLIRLELSGGRLGWFLPMGMVKGQYVRFSDFDGKPRKRYLYGTKTKRAGDIRVVGMHWHYAPRLVFSLGEVDEALVEAHVAFTDDGRHVLGDPEKVHKIRRSFCKQWFNEQWRTLHLAYFSFLSEGTESIVMPVARDQSCEIDTRPERYACPVTFTPPPRKSKRQFDAPGSAPEDEVPLSEIAEDEVPEEDLDADVDPAIDPWDDFDSEDVE